MCPWPRVGGLASGRTHARMHAHTRARTHATGVQYLLHTSHPLARPSHTACCTPSQSHALPDSSGQASLEEIPVLARQQRHPCGRIGRRSSYPLHPPHVVRHSLQTVESWALSLVHTRGYTVRPRPVARRRVFLRLTSRAPGREARTWRRRKGCDSELPSCACMVAMLGGWVGGAVSHKCVRAQSGAPLHLLQP